MIEFKPTCLFYGEDEFQKEEFVKRVTASILDTESLPFNLNIYDAKEIDTRVIIDTANTLPFLSKHRVIIINNVESLKEDQINLLAAYSKNPNPNTCLMLLVNKAKLPEEFSGLNSDSKRFNPLANEELFIWIKNRLKLSSVDIETDALELIIELTGNNLRIISSELEKLKTYIGKRPIIKKEDVQNLLGISIQNTAFDFIDLIFKEDSSGALKALNSIKTDIERHPPRLIGLILWNFKQILKVKSLLDEGKKDYEIFQAVRMKRKTTSDFIRQARKLNLKNLRRIFKLLLDLDLSLKRSKVSPQTGYELLSAQLLARELI